MTPMKLHLIFKLEGCIIIAKQKKTNTLSSWLTNILIKYSWWITQFVVINEILSFDLTSYQWKKDKN